MVQSTATSPGNEPAGWLDRLLAHWAKICVVLLVPTATWWMQDLAVFRNVSLVLRPDTGMGAMRSTRVLAAAVALALVPYVLRALWGDGRLACACVAYGSFGFAAGRVFGGDHGSSAAVASLLGVLVLLCRPRRIGQATLNSGVDPDAPIESSAEDLFERSGVVERCVKYLLNPYVRCPRLAVYAPYGSGKSSVAMLVRERLRSEGHLFVRFDPWHHTQDEHAVLDALLLSVEHALGRGEVGWMGLRAAIRRTVAAVAGKHEWAAGIRAPVERFLLVSNQELATTLAKHLAGKRLVVFVDDLERCSAEIAERVLTTIKEAFSVPGLAFLFAIDRVALGERLKKRDAGDLPDKVFDDSVDLLPPSSTALRRIESEALARGESWKYLCAPLKQLSSLLPQPPRRRKRFLQRLQSWPADLASVQTVLDLEVALALMLLEFDAPGSLEFLLVDQGALDDLQSGALREAVAKAWDKEAPSSPQPSASLPWSTSMSAQATHAWIRNRQNRSHATGVDEHVLWLLARELPVQAQLLHILHDIPLDAQPALWLERLRQVDAADDRAMHHALVAHRERQIEAAAGALDVEAQSHCLSRAVRVSEVRKELLRGAGKPLLEDISSFEQAFHALLMWAHFGGNYHEAHEAEWKAIQEHVVRAREAVVEIHLSVFALRGREYMNPADVARIAGALCDHTRPLAERAVRDGQMDCVRRILGVREELLGASYRMLVDIAETASPIFETHTVSSREDWDALHGLFDSLCRDADQATRAKKERLATAVWLFLTSKRLNRRMAGSLSEALQLWEGQVGNPALPRPDWWAEATAKSTGGWVPGEA